MRCPPPPPSAGAPLRARMLAPDAVLILRPCALHAAHVTARPAVSCATIRGHGHGHGHETRPRPRALRAGRTGDREAREARAPPAPARRTPRRGARARSVRAARGGAAPPRAAGPSRSHRGGDDASWGEATLL